MNPPHPRGVCPSLSAPLQTGDGLLVRLLPEGPIAPEDFVALCAAAQRDGNGLIEISARGSLQVRGLTTSSALRFAADATVGKIAGSATVPVMSDPLPQDPDAVMDCTGLASAVRAAITAADLRLAPKVSIVLDGGGRLHLEALNADVCLRAVRSGVKNRLHLAVAGDARTATSLGAVAPETAPALVRRLLIVIAEHGPTARAADVLRERGPAAFNAALDGLIEPTALPRLRPPAEPIGCHRLRGGRLALGVALAFGHATAHALAELARAAAAAGAHSLRPAPARALLVIGLAQPGADVISTVVEKLGFVLRADDPRRRITACAGAPACAFGFIPARMLGAELARALPNLREEIHVSGCAKGCAHPRPAALTIVGNEQGCGIVRHATARAVPFRHVEPAALVATVARELPAKEASHG